MSRPDRLLRASLLAGACALAACSDQIINTTQVDLYGPSGLAVAPARDRDLLFVASTGGDDLRAITMCNIPSDAGTLYDNSTCTDDVDFHFLPGPLRLFPGSFPTGNRPVRLAAVNLRDVDGGVVGGIMAAGVASLVGPDGGVSDTDAGIVSALPALKLVDAQNLLDATEHAAALKTPSDIPLDGPPIDVVSVEVETGDTPVAGAAQQAFVLTQANEVSGVPAEITELSLTPSQGAPQASVVGRCSLDFTAMRLALIPAANSELTTTVQVPIAGDPGETMPVSVPTIIDGVPIRDLLYVSDGTPNGVPGGIGDGAVEIQISTIPPLSGSVPPCTIHRRLVATDPDTGEARGLASIALSPRFFESLDQSNVSSGGKLYYPAGFYLMGASTDGLVVILRTDLGVAPLLPPFHALPPIDGGVSSGGTNVALIINANNTETGDVLPDGTVRPELDDGGYGDPVPNLPLQPMEPLRVNGLAREVAFMRTPLSCPDGWPEDSPCTIVTAGITENTYQQVGFPLVGLVTGSDGYMVFVDVQDRRFVSDTRDATTGSPGFPAAVDTTTYTFSPAQVGGNPTLTFTSADTLSPQCISSTPDVACRPAGWSAAGVARQSTWRAVWHAQVPGLERQGGLLTDNGDGRLLFTMPGVDLSRWTDPALNDPLGVGDVLSFAAFSDPNSSTAAVCDVLTLENENPLLREFTIAAIGPNYFILDPSPITSTDTQPLTPAALEAAGCFVNSGGVLGIGGTVEVRTGAAFATADAPLGKPWLIYQGDLIHGRAFTCPAGVSDCSPFVFVGTETRFDYPLAYQLFLDTPCNNGSLCPDQALLPTVGNDIGVAFTIGAPEPTTAQAQFIWTVESGQSPSRVADTAATAGFAGPIISYTSLKIPGNLVFFSSTGTDSLVQADPALLAVTNGVLSYR